MHIDMSATGFVKEEIFFMGLALSQSKACVSFHFTANNLDYYERIFLRTLVNAKVGYYFRN